MNITVPIDITVKVVPPYFRNDKPYVLIEAVIVNPDSRPWGRDVHVGKLNVYPGVPSGEVNREYCHSYSELPWIWSLRVEPMFYRKGIAKALITRAIEEYGPRLGACILDDNIASQRTFTSLGFKQNRVTNYYHDGKLAHDWVRR